MRKNRFHRWLASVSAISVLALASPHALAKEPSTALELARQLNQAFIEVADQISPCVVVIQVSHKQGFSEPNLDEDNPFWDLIPREFRKQFEQRQQREKPRRENKQAPRDLVPDGQGSGVVIREEVTF